MSVKIEALLGFLKSNSLHKEASYLIKIIKSAEITDEDSEGQRLIFIDTPGIYDLIALFGEIAQNPNIRPGKAEILEMFKDNSFNQEYAGIENEDFSIEIEEGQAIIIPISSDFYNKVINMEESGINRTMDLNESTVLDSNTLGDVEDSDPSAPDSSFLNSVTMPTARFLPGGEIEI
jgi:hypothetical protein